MDTKKPNTTKPLFFAVFITKRPWTALLLVLMLPLTLSAIAMPNFSLNDLEGWDVRDGISSVSVHEELQRQPNVLVYVLI